MADFVQVEGQTLPKPAYGQPCNGCGACCLLRQCVASRQVFGAQPRCPAIEVEEGRYLCGMMRHPAKYLGSKLPSGKAPLLTRYFKVMLDSGGGCDMPGDWNEESLKQTTMQTLSWKYKARGRDKETVRLAAKLRKFLPYRKNNELSGR